MGANISVTKIKHLEKFMQNIPLNIFSRIPSANKQGQINNNWVEEGHNYGIIRPYGRGGVYYATNNSN